MRQGTGQGVSKAGHFRRAHRARALRDKRQSVKFNAFGNARFMGDTDSNFFPYAIPMPGTVTLIFGLIRYAVDKALIFESHDSPEAVGLYIFFNIRCKSSMFL